MLCTTCNRPAEAGYVNEAAGERCIDVCHTTFTRIRQSIGSQLRETLDELVGKGWIEGWRLIDGTSYVVTRHGLSTTMSPGEAMAFVNSYGYDVRFGKA
jgi:hypothetical protein